MSGDGTFLFSQLNKNKQWFTLEQATDNAEALEEVGGSETSMVDADLCLEVQMTLQKYHDEQRYISFAQQL